MKTCSFRPNLPDDLKQKTKESGTYTWETLEYLDILARTSTDCDVLAGVLEAAIDAISRAIYISEADFLMGVIGHAGDAYSKNCGEDKVSISSSIFPSSEAGTISFTLNLANEPSMERITKASIGLMAGGFAGIEWYDAGTTFWTREVISGRSKLGTRYTMSANVLSQYKISLFTITVSAVVAGLMLFGQEIWKQRTLAAIEENNPPFNFPSTEAVSVNQGFTFDWAVTENDNWHFESLDVSGGSVTYEGEKNGKIIFFDDATITVNFTEGNYTLTTRSMPGEGGTISPEGKTWHEPYSIVNIYASPKDGWRLEKWGADAAAFPPNNTIDFTMTHNDSLVAGLFLKTWDVSVDVIGDGSVTPNGGTYDDEEVATFTAVPENEEEFEFIGWTGDVISDEQVITITVDSDKGLMATFAPRPILTTSANPPEGGTIMPSGTSFYDKNTEVDLQVSPNSGFVFTSMTGDVLERPDGSFFVVMDTDKTVTANFVEQYKLEMSAQPADGGNATPSGITYYDPDTEVTLTATPATPEHKFNTWSGDLISEANPATIVMDSDKSITAVFHEPVTLTLLALPADEGTVSPAGETQVIYGEDVEIYGMPNDSAEYYFNTWLENGVSIGSQNPKTVLMEADRTITGDFKQLVNLNIMVRGIGGSTYPEGTLSLKSGAEVTVIGQPLSDYLFDFWDGDYESTDNPVKIIVSEDSGIYANFILRRTLVVGVSGDGTTNPLPGEYTFLKDGQTIELQAISGGQAFTNWTDQDGASYADNPIVVTMDADKTMTANFHSRYTLKTVAIPQEGGSVSPTGTTLHMENEIVPISATPAENFIFTGWQGSLSGNTNPTSILMDSDKEVYASFDGLFLLSTDVTGEGEISQPAESWHQADTEIIIYAIARDGWVLNGWKGDFNSPPINPLTFEINEDINLITVFVESFELTASVSPDDDAGSVWPAGVTEWEQGTNIWCAATPTDDTKFGYWSGDIDGNIEDNPTLVVLDKDKSITAHFYNYYTLSVGIEPAGSGYTIPMDTGNLKYPPGKVVTITAYAEPDWEFSHWTGIGRETSNPISVTMDQNRKLAAHFIYRGSQSGSRNTLTTEVEGEGGDVFPKRIELETGGVVVVEATPDGGYEVSDWIPPEEVEELEPEEGDGKKRRGRVTVDRDKTVTVLFARDWNPVLFRLLEIGYDSLYPEQYTNCNWLLERFDEIDEIKEMEGIPDYVTALADSTAEMLAGYYSTHCQILYTIETGEALPTPDAGVGEIAFVSAPDLEYPILFPPEGGVGFLSGLWLEGSVFELTARISEGYEFDNWLILKGGSLIGEPGDYPGSLELTTDTKLVAVFASPPPLAPPKGSYLITSTEPPEGGTVTPSGSTYREYGEQVTCTAFPTRDWEFDHWESGFLGLIDSLANPIVVGLEGDDRHFIAHFKRMYTLIVKTSPSMSGSVTPGTGEHERNTIVALYPHNTENWLFHHWSGDYEGVTIPASVLMDEDKTVTAHFESRDTVSLTLIIEGREDGGTVTPELGETWWAEGATITIQALPKTEDGFVFRGWRGDINSDNFKKTILMDSDKTVYARFARIYEVRAYVKPTWEAGNIIGSGRLYEEGEIATLEVTPNTDWHFVEWRGHDTPTAFEGNTENPLLFITNDEQIPNGVLNLDAELEGMYLLFTESRPPEGGVVVPPPAWLLPGTEVICTATPNEGWGFLYWAPEGFEENPKTITMATRQYRMSANFGKLVTLTTSIEGEGTISQPPVSEWASEDVITIEAFPTTGWILSKWGGDIVSEPSNPLYYKIIVDTHITAIFVEDNGKPPRAPGKLFYVYPLKIDFGEIEVGNDEEAMILATNDSEQDVEILNPILKPIQGSGFKLSEEESVVRAGEQEVEIANIAFYPTIKGEVEANFEFDAFGAHTIVRISGTGIDALPLPENKVTISPTEIDFGNVLLNTKVEHPFSISIKGAPVRIISSLITHDIQDDSAFFMEVPFQFDPLVEGTDYTGKIIYLPQSESLLSHSGYFVCRTDGSPQEVSIRLQGQSSIERLLLSETNIEFGLVSIGVASFRRIYITNTGNVTANFSGLRTPDNYEGHFLKTQALPGNTITLIITFSPTTGDIYPGEVEFAAFPEGTFVIPVDGKGKVFNPLDPGNDIFFSDKELGIMIQEVDFGTINRGDNVVKTVGRENPGLDEVEFLSGMETLKGVNCFAYSTGDSILPPSGSSDFKIYCNPEVSGEVISLLTFDFRRIKDGFVLQPQCLVLRVDVV